MGQKDSPGWRGNSDFYKLLAGRNTHRDPLQSACQASHFLPFSFKFWITFWPLVFITYPCRPSLSLSLSCSLPLPSLLRQAFLLLGSHVTFIILTALESSALPALCRLFSSHPLLTPLNIISAVRHRCSCLLHQGFNWLSSFGAVKRTNRSSFDQIILQLTPGLDHSCDLILRGAFFFFSLLNEP